MINYSDTIFTIFQYFSLILCAIYIKKYFNDYGKFRIKEYVLFDTDTKYFVIEEKCFITWERHLNKEFSIYDNYTESTLFSSYQSALNFFSSNNMYKGKKLIN